MPNRVFISYRVGDRQNEAALIARQLGQRIGPRNVFFASHSIGPGEDYRVALQEGLRSSSILLVLIGPHWLQVDSATGQPRIHGQDDWVRAEIRLAEEIGLKVLPVLIEDHQRGLAMPRADQLPADIASLANYQYIRMNYQDLNLDRLMAAITGPGTEQTTGRRPGTARWSVRTGARRFLRPLVVAGAAAVVVGTVAAWAIHLGVSNLTVQSSPGRLGVGKGLYVDSRQKVWRLADAADAVLSLGPTELVGKHGTKVAANPSGRIAGCSRLTNQQYTPSVELTAAASADRTKVFICVWPAADRPALLTGVIQGSIDHVQSLDATITFPPVERRSG